MVSGRACAPAPAAPSSGAGVARVGSASQPRGRSFSSLRGRSQIGGVRRRGTRRRVGGISVIAAVGVPGETRVAVVAGRKVGPAVLRNRAKRRLREAVARAPIRQGYDYIVVASPGVLEAGFEEIVVWVTRAVGPEE